MDGFSHSIIVDKDIADLCEQRIRQGSKELLDRILEGFEEENDSLSRDLILPVGLGM
jgi:hypothetical protein